MPDSNIKLYPVDFQAPIRSKTLRENFALIEDSINSLKNDINALSTAASGSELSIARDCDASLADSLRKRFRAFGNGLISGRHLCSCSSALEWSALDAALNPTEDTENSSYNGNAINMGKDSSEDEMTYQNYLGSAKDLSSSKIKVLLFINSSCFSDVSSVKLLLNDDTDFASTNIEISPESSLKEGWNELLFNVQSGNLTGTVDSSAVQYLRLKLTTAAPSDSISLGSVKLAAVIEEGSEGKVRAEGTDSVRVQSGEAVINGYSVCFQECLSSSFNFPSGSNDRIDAVCVGYDNTIDVFKGAEHSSPSYPLIPDSHIPLAYIYLRGGSSVIQNEYSAADSYIIDSRRFLPPFSRPEQGFLFNSDSLGAGSYGLLLYDSCENGVHSNPSVHIKRENSSGPALQVNDGFVVNSDGSFIGSNIVPFHFDFDMLLWNYNGGVSLPSEISTMNKVLVNVSFCNYIETNGSTMDFYIYYSLDGGTTDISAYHSHNSTNITAPENYYTSACFFVPVVNGKIWLKYYADGIGDATNSFFNSCVSAGLNL